MVYQAKRGIDLVVSLVLLLLLWPFFFVLTILVAFSLKESPFFTQKRVGYKEKIFVLFKLKTMKSIYNNKGYRLTDNERITSLGAWLRKTRIDELPQLFNVLRGDMSLVGPRPLLPEYLSRYTTEVRKSRHIVRPGITGWAQIYGGHGLAWEERFAWDLLYVEKCSLWLDLTILLKTPFFLLLAKEGDNIGPYSKEK